MYEEAYAQIKSLIAEKQYLPAANRLQELYVQRYRELSPHERIRPANLVFELDPQNTHLLRLKVELFLIRTEDALAKEEYRRAYRYFDSLASLPLPYEQDPELHLQALIYAEKLYRGIESVRLLEFIGQWGQESLFCIATSGESHPLLAKVQTIVWTSLHAAVKRRVMLDGIEIDWLLPLAREVVFSIPIDYNMLRAYARFLISLEQQDEAFPIYQYVYPELKGTPHFWADLAYCFPDEPTIQIGLLFTALSKHGDEKYLGRTKKRLADLLYQEGYGEAAAEQIESMLANRQKYQYHISPHTRKKYERLMADFPASQGSSLPVADAFMHEAQDVIRRGMTPETWVACCAPYNHTHGMQLKVENNKGERLAFYCDGMPDLMEAISGMAFSLYIARLRKDTPPMVVYGEHPQRVDIPC